MKLTELAEKLSLRWATRPIDREVRGVYLSDMVSDVIANAKAHDLLVTLQVHGNVVAAANLVDLCGIVISQGKQPSPEVVAMAEKAELPILTSELNRWQLATRLYEAGVR